MVNLGRLLEKGAEGVTPDPVRAAELLSRAVQNDKDIAAMSNPGVNSETGPLRTLSNSTPVQLRKVALSRSWSILGDF